jgi:N utilization substance protein A
MNREFVEAMQHLALERGVSVEEILEAFKEALAALVPALRGPLVD